LAIWGGAPFEGNQPQIEAQEEVIPFGHGRVGAADQDGLHHLLHAGVLQSLGEAIGRREHVMVFRTAEAGRIEKPGVLRGWRLPDEA